MSNDDELLQEAIHAAKIMVQRDISIITYYGVNLYIETYMTDSVKKLEDKYSDGRTVKKKADALYGILNHAITETFNYLASNN